MRLQLRKPAQALNKAYAKQSISQERIDVFRQALARLFDRLDETESEEHQKNIVAGFLNDSFYGPAGPLGQFEINTRERVDLVIHTGPTSAALPGVLIEAKKVFASEMMTTLKNNVKSLHELILYYFEEREKHQNIAVSHLIITDVYNWFFFDENDFRHFFYDNAKLKNLYKVKKQQNKDNTFFYNETARLLREMDDEVPVTCLNLREMATLARTGNPDDLRRLIPVYKLFSPEHLLKLPFANDANTLNRSFYNELLHIVGLHETTVEGLKLIERLPENDRLEGSLLENTINVLRVDNALADLKDRSLYGRDNDDQLFGVALELCITWLNRILFLKLLEGQLMRYQGSSSQNLREVQFLTPRHIREFDELSELFFEVLAVPEANRPAGIVTRYGNIPYLNSSLFELTDLERKVLKIKALKDRLELPLFDHTALKTPQGKRQTGKLPALQYLLAFLDAYDFSSEGPAEIQPDNKPLINAAVLGLIFEKLNGYRDGSFFTPGFVTMYMVRDLIRRAVLTRFNEQFGWHCTDITALYNHLDRVGLAEANAVVNGLRVVDPAVGSGHFLVSALNEIIALKAELGILTDRDGRRLRHYDISIVNDELVITDEDGDVFQYKAGKGGEDGRGKTVSSPSQRIQETIFHEKQTIIENCLFGVDLNSNSINICRLRLWIELLKSAYYQNNALNTLPNLDINLKVGNSLVGRFGVGFRIDSLRNGNMREKFLGAFRRYSVDVMAYKECRDKAEKDRIRGRIADFQAFVQQVAMVDQKEYAEIRELEAKLAQSVSTFDFFNQDDRLEALNEQLAAKKSAFADKQRVYRQAFEWRFAFPEVLDEAGQYVGFDVVVGNPPYGVNLNQSMGDLLAKQYETYSSRGESYVLFIERALSLLKEGGQFGFIIPDTLLNLVFTEKARLFLLKQSRLQEVTALPSDVFSEATVDTILISSRKETSDSDFIETDVNVRLYNKKAKLKVGLQPERTFVVSTRLWYSHRSFNVQSDLRELALLERIDSTFPVLSQFAELFYGIKVYQVGKGKPAQTPHIRDTKPFTNTTQLTDDWLPFYDGKHIGRYELLWQKNNYLHYGPWLAEARLPEKFEGEKILIRKITGDTLIATYVAETSYCNTLLFVLKLFPQKAEIPYKALLGILNSRFIGWYFRKKFQISPDDTFPQIMIRDILQFAIPNVLNDRTVQLEQAVEKILSAKAADRTADTAALEAEVDALVYGLYGLSAEEIGVVAPASPESPELLI